MGDNSACLFRQSFSCSQQELWREEAGWAVASRRERLAASLACHSAVRAGQALNLEAMNAIVERGYGSGVEEIRQVLLGDQDHEVRTRAVTVLGWQPEVSLEDGLARLLSALGRDPAAAAPSR